MMLILYLKKKSQFLIIIYIIIKGPRVDGGDLHFDGIHELKNAEVIIYDFEKKIFRKKFEDSMIHYNVQTSVQGLSEIMDDGSLFVEETQRGRLLFLTTKEIFNGNI